MLIELCVPKTNKKLLLSPEKNFYLSQDGALKFPIVDNIISFLATKDTFYEGAYLNRIHFLPKKGSFVDRIALWIINGGYLWAVNKTFKKGDVLLELGCASGVDFFGEQFNMIGLDLSLRSLQGLHNYKWALQADATELPLADGSVDGILSSYFWEHIPPTVKDLMLEEFRRVLKPNGKLVFLYDVETKNGFINLLKKKDLALYNKLFLDRDGHLGYETPKQNRERLEQHKFFVQKHFGMERSWIQSSSVHEKFRNLDGIGGVLGKLFYPLALNRLSNYASMAFIRVFDETLGRLYPLSKSRIIITIAKKGE